ncbi:hypothetical protein OUZ56_005534 [Daphnia magna]|uniref:Reverse transcriptase domain-containing protein n=1 Tax=Daphnia magna TaxID=35525 RepID=A0ABQ9YT17_9CRUS|nr:hypothetical protein OUZ56_005534 [Daphnia magna]
MGKGGKLEGVAIFQGGCERTAAASRVVCVWCAVVYGGAIATKDRTGQLKEPHRGLIQPQKRQLKPNSFSSHGRQLAAHGPTIKNYCDHSLVALCLSKAVCIKHMLECNLDMRIAYDDIPASTLIDSSNCFVFTR